MCGPEYTLVVFPKNCEPELSFIADCLFNMFLRESLFPYSWKVFSVITVIENVIENCGPLSLVSVIGKLFDKLLNNKCIDHHYGSAADFLTAVFGRTSRFINRTGATFTCSTLHV